MHDADLSRAEPVGKNLRLLGGTPLARSQKRRPRGVRSATEAVQQARRDTPPSALTDQVALAVDALENVKSDVKSMLHATELQTASHHNPKHSTMTSKQSRIDTSPTTPINYTNENTSNRTMTRQPRRASSLNAIVAERAPMVDAYRASVSANPSAAPSPPLLAIPNASKPPTDEHPYRFIEQSIMQGESYLTHHDSRIEELEDEVERLRDELAEAAERHGALQRAADTALANAYRNGTPFTFATPELSPNDTTMHMDPSSSGRAFASSECVGELGTSATEPSSAVSSNHGISKSTGSSRSTSVSSTSTLLSLGGHHNAWTGANPGANGHRACATTSTTATSTPRPTPVVQPAMPQQCADCELSRAERDHFIRKFNDMYDYLDDADENVQRWSRRSALWKHECSKRAGRIEELELEVAELRAERAQALARRVQQHEEAFARQAARQVKSRPASVAGSKVGSSRSGALSSTTSGGSSWAWPKSPIPRRRSHASVPPSPAMLSSSSFTGPSESGRSRRASDVTPPTLSLSRSASVGRPRKTSSPLSLPGTHRLVPAIAHGLGARWRGRVLSDGHSEPVVIAAPTAVAPSSPGLSLATYHDPRSRSVKEFVRTRLDTVKRTIESAGEHLDGMKM